MSFFFSSAAPAATTPTLVSATILADGTTLREVWSENITHGAGGNGGVALTGLSGGATTLSSPSITGTQRDLTISRTVLSSETGGSYAYTQPGNGIEASDDGTDAETFSGTSVTNSSTQTGAASPPFNDNFNRANANPIAADWETGLGANGSVKLDSNTVTGVSGFGVASVKTSALSIGGNQRATIRYVSGNPDVRYGPVVRMQSSGAHYRMWFSQDFSQGAIVHISSGGTETEIGARFFTAFGSDSDTRLGLEINGDSLTAFRINGATRTDLATRTDSTLTGGQPGFFVHSDCVADDFDATNF